MLKTGMIVVFLAGTAGATYLGISRIGDEGHALPAIVDVEESTPRSVEIDPPESTRERPKQLDPAYLMSLAVSTEEAMKRVPPESCSGPAGCESDAASPSAKPDQVACPPCDKCN